MSIIATKTDFGCVTEFEILFPIYTLNMMRDNSELSFLSYRKVKKYILQQPQNVLTEIFFHEFPGQQDKTFTQSQLPAHESSNTRCDRTHNTTCVSMCHFLNRMNKQCVNKWNLEVKVGRFWYLSHSVVICAVLF